MDKLCGKTIGIHHISYVCLIRYLLALNLILEKPKCLSPVYPICY